MRKEQNGARLASLRVTDASPEAQSQHPGNSAQRDATDNDSCLATGVVSAMAPATASDASSDGAALSDSDDEGQTR